MTRANILTSRQYCERMCWKSSSGDWNWGDVRRCPHGRVWHLGLQWIFATEDCWDRLSPWLNPTKYRRAVRALAAAEVTE